MYIIVNDNLQYVDANVRLTDRESAAGYRMFSVARERAREAVARYGEEFAVLDASDGDAVVYSVMP